MSKYEDTRIVTFTEDYSKPTRNGGVRVYYKKNTTHAIHKKMVELFKAGGAKMKVEELDMKKVYAERKKALAQAKKRQIEAAYTDV
jgi:hypothetical protein